MKRKNISRRNFIGQASCAALGSTTLLSTLCNLKYMNAASMVNSSVMFGNDYKAMVCVLLSGGCDSFNMLIPREQGLHNDYSITRSELAIPRNEILALNNSDYGLHPSMGGIQNLYNSNKLSFISNIGTLIQKMNKEEVYQNEQLLPLGLFSHSDQIQQWQTSIPHDRSSIGWGGKLADLMSSQNTNDKISMNISLSGSNIYQTGNNTVEFTVDRFEGSTSMFGYDSNPGDAFTLARKNAVDNILDSNYADIFEKTYIDVIRRSRDADAEFSAAIDSAPLFSTVFSANEFSDALRMIARTIAAREQLGMRRQIFFVEYGGWDHHDELLNNQAEMLLYLSDGMNEFNTAMEQLNVSDCVTTFVSSEFGRTLSSNGNGTDHAWGGNVMVMGGPINGGQIFGQYPSLALGSELELGGGGLLLPTTSVDEYFAELAIWFGVAKSELPTIFPNIGNFYDINSVDMPIGFFNG